MTGAVMTGIARALMAAVLMLASAACAATSDRSRVLRVCADPNNMPFSNEAGEGFENRLAEVIADELDARVEYTWFAQRRGFVRNTLRAGECDVIMGVPGSFELALPTRPYYRSTYVFVYRSDTGLDIESLDDPRLRELRVGVQIIGDDYTNSPPAHALANRGIVNNVRGFSVIGDYRQEAPPARIMDAVADGRVDVAVVWGPLAGWYAHARDLPVELVPVKPEIDLPFLPFVFDIAMGVRREDTALRDELDGVLQSRAADIDAILREYHVPVVRTGGAAPRLQ
ncbi:MAG TPA: substrate-binding domain-containing protein [Longimicrobiales bacterium]|nr:substrate-binding domain-containing protein [Longimicrobiales bacterium]